MSAFLHSDLHTAQIAHELVRRGLVPDTDAITIAMTLRDCNNKALAARYGSRATPTPLGSLKSSNRVTGVLKVDFISPGKSIGLKLLLPEGLLGVVTKVVTSLSPKLCNFAAIIDGLLGAWIRK
jgi:hypothetical protein